MEERRQLAGFTEKRGCCSSGPLGMGFRLGLVAKGDPAQYVNIRKTSLVNF